MIQSLPYKPDPAKCCEACVFGTGEHEPWCHRMWSEYFAFVSDATAEYAALYGALYETVVAQLHKESAAQFDKDTAA